MDLWRVASEVTTDRATSSACGMASLCDVEAPPFLTLA